MRLRAVLPADRTQLGRVYLEGAAGAILWGPVPCLGKSDNQQAALAGNPRRDPTRPYGDHPHGTYAILGWAPTLPEEKDKYGAAGKLVLDPIRGQALEAKQNGRYGLLIHGGKRGGPYGLRPTFGCLRLRDDDCAALIGLWRSYHDSATPMKMYHAEEEG